MNGENDVRKLVDELWRLVNQESAVDSNAALEHLSYLLYFKLQSRHERLWDEMFYLCRNNIRQAVDFYQYDMVKNKLEFLVRGSSVNGTVPFSFRVFERIVFLLENHSSIFTESFLVGQVFELLLEKAFSQRLGIVLTPRLLSKSMAKLLVETVDRVPNHVAICDPACGTGTLLHALAEEMSRERAHSRLVGFEMNTLVARVAQFNLLFREIEDVSIYNEDGLSVTAEYREKFDYVITNPPIVKRYERVQMSTWYSMNNNNFSKNGTRSYEFIELSLSLLKREGRCAIIVPEGMLSSGTRYDTEFRRHLLYKFRIEGIISLPAGLFPGTGMKTSILLISNTYSSPNREIWFYEFDDKPNRLRNDEKLWDDLINRWQMYVELGYASYVDNGHTWTTSFMDIENNQFQLAASAYRRRSSPRHYVDPSRLINELKELEWKIKLEMDELYRIHFKEQPDVPPPDAEFKKAVTATKADLSTVRSLLYEHFSEKQKALFNVFMDAGQPLAVHEATKLANQGVDPNEKIGVQEARQIVELLEAMGLLEPVSSGAMLYPKQSSDESDRVISLQKPLIIALWKRAEHLRR